MQFVVLLMKIQNAAYIRVTLNTVKNSRRGCVQRESDAFHTDVHLLLML